MGLKLFSRSKPSNGSTGRRSRRHGKPSPSNVLTSEYNLAPCETLENDPLRRLFQQGRYNVILRKMEKWRDHPDCGTLVEQAKDDLEQRMGLVPAGSVIIPRTLTAQAGAPEDDIEVEPYLLDVLCVTNARFQKFVDSGGYDTLECWPEEIWPHLIELKDLTSQPSPRFWRNGRHDAARAEHPVVGVSWYEAQAYALWIGQRLPGEAEWQMAASWHIKSSTDMMRRFPWGDAMDNTRCNVWSSRHGTTVPVTEYDNGAAPNQVRQLAGNVWEWTDTEYAITDDDNRPIIGEMPMHVIRGGAFDTYFETQATNYFRTGQIALARTHNTGFRCAMNLSEACWISGE